MNANPAPKLPLDDPPVHIKLKLSAFWSSLMFCYIYGDYFGLYAPGKMAEMIAGKMGPLGPASAGVLIGVSVMMAIPSLMVVLSLILPATANRWLNLTLGLAYAAIMAVSMPGAWPFYVFLGVIEIIVCLAIVGLAWTWPRADGAPKTFGTV